MTPDQIIAYLSAPDTIASDELAWFAANDRALYRDHIKPLHRKLDAMRCDGSYNATLATRSFLRVANLAARAYVSPRQSYEYQAELAPLTKAREAFSARVSRQTAEALRARYEANPAIDYRPCVAGEFQAPTDRSGNTPRVVVVWSHAGDVLATIHSCGNDNSYAKLSLYYPAARVAFTRQPTTGDSVLDWTAFGRSL